MEDSDQPHIEDLSECVPRDEVVSGGAVVSWLVPCLAGPPTLATTVNTF